MLTDTAGLELGRVRAGLSFHDPELGRMQAGAERDVILTEGVRLLVKMKLLTLLHVYPDPAVEDVVGPADDEPAVEPDLQDPLDPEAELEAEVAAEQGSRAIEVELTSTGRGTTQQR